MLAVNVAAYVLFLGVDGSWDFILARALQGVGLVGVGLIGLALIMVGGGLRSPDRI